MGASFGPALVLISTNVWANVWAKSVRATWGGGATHRGDILGVSQSTCATPSPFSCPVVLVCSRAAHAVSLQRASWRSSMAAVVEVMKFKVVVKNTFLEVVLGAPAGSVLGWVRLGCGLPPRMPTVSPMANPDQPEFLLEHGRLGSDLDDIPRFRRRILPRSSRRAPLMGVRTSSIGFVAPQRPDSPSRSHEHCFWASSLLIKRCPMEVPLFARS